MSVDGEDDSIPVQRASFKPGSTGEADASSGVNVPALLSSPPHPPCLQTLVLLGLVLWVYLGFQPLGLDWNRNTDFPGSLAGR